MKPADVFAVVVRTIGLVMCLASGSVLFFALINLVLGGPASIVGLCILGIPAFLIGLWLLRGAPSIIAYAFPKNGRISVERSSPTGRPV